MIISFFPYYDKKRDNMPVNIEAFTFDSCQASLHLYSKHTLRRVDELIKLAYFSYVYM